MIKNIRLYKKICAWATVAVMVAGFPMSVHATEPDNNDTEYEAVDVEEDDSEAPEEVIDEEEEEVEEVAATSESSEETVSDEEDEAEEPDESVASEDSDDEASAEEADDEELTYVNPLEEDHPSGILMLDADPDEMTTSEGSAEGSGSLKLTTIKKPKNVVSMVVPILGNIDYDFVLDPEGLVALNPNNNLVGGESSVYFRSYDSDNTYTVFADVAVAVNRSTVPVILQVELNVRGASDLGITLTDLKNVHSSETPALCFGILPTEVGTVVGDSAVPEMPVVKSEMAVTDANGYAFKEIFLPGSVDNFEILTLPTSEQDVYVQEYRALEDARWSTAGFTLYGACTRNADWSETFESMLNGGNLYFTVTYKMTPVFEDNEDE